MCPVNVWARSMLTGRMSWRLFILFISSDPGPWGSVGYPAGVAIVGPCADGCVLGSGASLASPGNDGASTSTVH